MDVAAIMIRSTGVFLQTADFAARFQLVFKKRLDNGLLYLRDIPEDGETVHDLPILEEWKTAQALLKRFRAAASGFLNGEPARLGKVWIEQLPGHSATPWQMEEDEYAQGHIRTRTCIVPAPDAYTLSGLERLLLSTGVVNVVEHRVLHSEINLSSYPRVHLIIDVQRPEPAEAEE